MRRYRLAWLAVPLCACTAFGSASDPEPVDHATTKDAGTTGRGPDGAAIDAASPIVDGGLTPIDASGCKANGAAFDSPFGGNDYLNGWGLPTKVHATYAQVSGQPTSDQTALYVSIGAATTSYQEPLTRNLDPAVNCLFVETIFNLENISGTSDLDIESIHFGSNHNLILIVQDLGTSKVLKITQQHIGFATEFQAIAKVEIQLARFYDVLVGYHWSGSAASYSVTVDGKDVPLEPVSFYPAQGPDAIWIGAEYVTPNVSALVDIDRVDVR